MSRTPLHRHQLAWLGEAGWRGVQQLEWDAEARGCLAHWAKARLPLVVTRQSGRADAESIALGLPAPGRWNRRRLALTVLRGEVLYFDEFPLAENAGRRLPPSARSPWRSLCASLKAIGVNTHVYGSHGWELLSGLDHVRKGSDIDLWLSVSDASQADAAVACLEAFQAGTLRLDGELVFPDGSAVAWREWPVWRSGRMRSLLVKSLNNSCLVTSPAWQEAMVMVEAA